MSRQKLIAPFVTTIALAASACASEVTVLQGEGGGGTSTGANPTGQGGVSGVCPQNVPDTGAPCQDETLRCDYEDHIDCILADAYCDDGRWVVEHYDYECNPPPPCPYDKPEHGSACYDENVECWYVSDWPCPGIDIAAYCSLGQWEVPEPLCNPPPPEYCYTIQNDVECENHVGYCAWRVGGCGDNPLAQAGCFPNVSCLEEPSVCSSDQTCTAVSIHPCWNDDCEVCDEAQALCL